MEEVEEKSVFQSLSVLSAEQEREHNDTKGSMKPKTVRYIFDKELRT